MEYLQSRKFLRKLLALFRIKWLHLANSKPEEITMKIKSFNILPGTAALEAQRASFVERNQALQAKLRQSISEYSFEEADRLYTELVQTNRLRQTVEEINLHLQAEQDLVATFLVGSTLLQSAFSILSKTPTEAIVYASGHRFGNLLTVEGLAELELEASEYVYASADAGFTGRLLADFEERGQVLTCYLHAHPGKGPSANHPSQIDLACQSRFEQGNYPTVGGIFSRDGYARFFSNEKPFRVIVAGKGADRVETNLFKITAP